ncbi:MAG: UDP-N-acetylmuramoyl-tripeptide--D-alanyl-D-alanine ligase [Candidatus Hydrothermales bacterium]
MKELIDEILKDLKAVKINSQEVEKDDIFIALEGEKTHGAYFYKSALERGAKLCILPEEFKDKVDLKDRVIFVKDTLKFLMELAKRKREEFKGKVIGITGTVGKTTLKFMLSHIMNKNNRKNYPSPKSYNNFIGVSLTFLNAPPDSEYIVAEAGINREGEMEVLSGIIKPDIAIITKVGPGHLEGLKSIAKVAEEKFKIAKDIPSTGYLVINKNIPFLEKLKTKARIVYFELDSKNAIWDNEKFIYSGEFEISLSVPSFGMMENAIAAFKTATILKLETYKDIFSDFKFPDLRMEIIKYKNALIILDSYNANPLSMEDTIKTGTFFKKKEKYLFMGDMLELGEYSEAYHREIARLLKSKNYNAVFTIGENSRFTFEEAQKVGLYSIHFDNREKMREKLVEVTQRDSLVIIKGSRKMEMEKILEGLRNDT